MALSHARLSDLRHRLRLPTFKNVAGALQGYHRSIFTGHGMDFDDMVPYLPGDDVTDIDWKASARAGEPIIRRFVKETNLAVLLACDTSIAMTGLAPSGQPKSEVAADLIDVIAYLARVRSDYLGVVYRSADGLAQVPARSGSEHFERARRALRGALADPAPDPVLPEVLARADSLIRRRTLVVIVGDDYSLTENSEAALKRLRVRNEVVFFAVADADLTALAGPVSDVRDGPLPDVLDDRDLREEIAGEVARHRLRQADLLRRVGVRSARVAGSDDIVPAFTALLGERR